MRVMGQYRFVYGCCVFLWVLYFFAFYIPFHYSHKMVVLKHEEETYVLERIKVVLRRFPLIMKEEARNSKNNLNNSQDIITPISDIFKLLIKNNTNPGRSKERCQASYTVTQDLLPDMSVLVVFQETDLLVNLLKMLVTLLVQTPPHIIKEIILINDNSLKSNYLNLLEDLPKMTLVNLTETLGAVGSRMIAASVASGEAILFADSNCFFTDDYWSQSLLETIMKNPNAIATPIIQKTINSIPKDEDHINFKGGFTWSLNFKWIPLNSNDQKNYRKDATSPIRSPVIPGDIYMMSRKNYLRIGEYDAGIDLMSLQNIALSIATWQCEGEIVMVPCSRILYFNPMAKNIKRLSINKERRRTTPAETVRESNFHRLRNAKRVAEIWMDEFSHYFYEVEPSSVPLNSEKIVERVKLRASLKCRSFSWYLLNVFTELAAPRPIIIAHGQLSNHQKCITAPQKNNDYSTNYKAPADLRSCMTNNINQNWDFSEDGWLFQKKLCLSSSTSEDDIRVFITTCEPGPQQRWQRIGKMMIHANSGFCIDSQSSEGALLQQCKEGSHSQRWDFTAELDPKFYKSN